MARKKVKPKTKQDWVLVYKHKNKFLRFYGDVVLLLGSVLTTHGLKYGGVYEFLDDLEE